MGYLESKTVKLLIDKQFFIDLTENLQYNWEISESLINVPVIGELKSYYISRVLKADIIGKRVVQHFRFSYGTAGRVLVKKDLTYEKLKSINMTEQHDIFTVDANLEDISNELSRRLFTQSEFLSYIHDELST